MPAYEVFATVSQRASKEQVASFVRKLTSLFVNRGGVIMSLERLKETALAYPIRKTGFTNTEGTSFVMKVISSPDTIRGFNEEMKNETLALRASVMKLKLDRKPPKCRQEQQSTNEQSSTLSS
mmetsp:Transcript_32540/g.52731  ORF Transcript_32540/g.52731 Transcript_32540/m.52731 type:complete len:123 (-) Transcript_32540:271-639(-)|eukprot:CAMPEP_0184670080 /NCGR_PEP_ID=MMETSP0308-20130426/80502_1 /TAXON_ID=38269 /ORGANISM="Gloeochaete witrockiana, Strain SAG 46.84" /LENGTH=122 /DNA_ID=CAMNT_0027116657 /DNA_START=95 /DNA_END=463 /DNA_ORIENTATION=-